MRLHARYYLWNKASDFGTGRVQDLRFDDSGLYMTDVSKEYGVYTSRIIDSGETGKCWGRAEAIGDWKPNTSVTISFFSSDLKQHTYKGITRLIEDWLSDETLSYAEKEEAFEACTSCKFSNCRDIMLKNMKGQYIWFIIRFQSKGTFQPSINRIKLWLDNENWLSFLPEVYQFESESADFTARFLGIFQNLYEEMNEKITSIPISYNIYDTDRDFLEWLSTWIGIENSDIWSDEQLRVLLKNAADWYRCTGTAEMILRMVELYVGVRPILIENYFTADPFEALNVWKSGNYPRDPFGFTLMLPSDSVRSEGEHHALIQIINQCKPAHMRAQLVFIEREWLYSDKRKLSSEIRLDGRTALL